MEAQGPDIHIPSHPPKLSFSVHCRPVLLRKRSVVYTPPSRLTGYQAVIVKGICQPTQPSLNEYKHISKMLSCIKSLRNDQHTIISNRLRQIEAPRKVSNLKILRAILELSTDGDIFILAQRRIAGPGASVIALHVQAVKVFSAALDDVGLE